MNISIIIINPNTFEFDKCTHLNNLTQFGNDLKQFITIQTVSFEHMMDVIITNIGMIHNTDLHGDTVVCHETDKNIYQMCFLAPETHPNKHDSNINKLAGYLCGEKIYGPCVVINSKIEENCTCSPANIDAQTLTEIIYRKFVHKGLFISCDDTKTIVEYDFLQTPLEYDKDPKSAEYRYIDIEMFGFTISIFLKNTSDNTVNKRATKLIGEHKINGDILLATKTTYEYLDLTNDIFNKLIKLAEGPLEYRKLKDDEQENDIKINNLPVAYNKYIVLGNRYKQYKDICHSCSKPFENNKYLSCSGCYRMKYHDTTCQNADWQNHKRECLINKVSINSNIN